MWFAVNSRSQKTLGNARNFYVFPSDQIDSLPFVLLCILPAILSRLSRYSILIILECLLSCIFASDDVVHHTSFLRHQPFGLKHGF